MEQEFIPLKNSMIIAVEGIDGCGKNTACDLLVKAFAKHGIEAVVFADFDSTGVGKAVRNIFLDSDAYPTPTAEIMLISAARYENMVRNVAPLLTEGKIIIMNRTSLSTLVYNGIVKNGDIGALDLLNIIAYGVAGVYKPALTLYIDAPLETCYERLNNRDKKDIHEQKSIEWFSGVENAYSFMRASRPFDFVTVKNDTTIEALDAALNTMVRSHLLRVLATNGYIDEAHLAFEQKRYDSEVTDQLNELKNVADTLSETASSDEEAQQ